MSTHRTLRRAVCSVLTLSALHASAGFAADDAPEADIIVTGSRIARPEFEASVPVQVITSKAIEETGKQNVADILSNLPAVGSAISSRTNSNFATTGNGISTVNLRNMQDQRTLVLVNGRRIVSGIGGQSIVDLNNIPTDLIQNVEVITGGASAVYGSEAVAGVVNFVMKDNFQGLEFRGQSADSDEGGNGRTLGSVVGGMNFLDNRGNVTFNFQYDKDDGLRSAERARSADDVPGRSSFTPQGLFLSALHNYTFDNSNTLVNAQTPDLQFNRNAHRYIAVPLERKLYSTLAHFDLTDNLTAFFEGSYSDMLSNSSLEPSAISNADGISLAGVVSPGLSVADNPFIPAVIRNEEIAAGRTVLGFRKRLSGVFDRSNEDHRYFHRLVGGLRGNAFGDWKWEAYVDQGETVENTHSETALRDRLFNAMDAIAGPNGGAPVCRDPVARAAGCAPFNPFGFNSVSDAASAYITNDHKAFATYHAAIKETVAAANLTGEVFSLPAGRVKVAAGLEYRKEQSTEIYDPDTQAGNTLGNALANTIGQYHVSEAYIETIVPLLKDAPGAHSLDAEAAVRVGDYSTVGNVTSWKAGLTWAPINDVRLRAVYSSATRAPAIGELFAGANQTFPTGLTDPCEGITATTAGNLANYCRSIPGVNQAIAANPNHTFTYAQSDTQTEQGFNLSNPNLKQEVAKTVTAGIVFTPEALHNFSASVDWFSIKIDDAIALVPRQVVIDDCANSGGTSSLCQYVTREPVVSARGRTPGTLYNIDSQNINSGGIRTEGIDTQVRYGFEFAGNQHLSASLTYTYLSKLALKAAASLPFDDEVGQLNAPTGGRLGAGFKHRANLTLDYSLASFDLVWTSRFLSAMQDTKVDPSLDPQFNNIGSFIYHDVQARYAFPWLQRVDAYVGVDNVFDKQPPVIGQFGASNVTGTETAADTYDPIGRFFYAGVQVKF